MPLLVFHHLVEGLHLFLEFKDLVLSLLKSGLKFALVDLHLDCFGVLLCSLLLDEVFDLAREVQHRVIRVQELAEHLRRLVHQEEVGLRHRRIQVLDGLEQRVASRLVHADGASL